MAKGRTAEARAKAKLRKAVSLNKKLSKEKEKTDRTKKINAEAIALEKKNEALRKAK